MSEGLGLDGQPPLRSRRGPGQSRMAAMSMVVDFGYCRASDPDRLGSKTEPDRVYSSKKYLGIVLLFENICSRPMASLTAMLLEDLANGRVSQCPCGGLFVSHMPTQVPLRQNFDPIEGRKMRVCIAFLPF